MAESVRVQRNPNSIFSNTQTNMINQRSSHLVNDEHRNTSEALVPLVNKSNFYYKINLRTIKIANIFMVNGEV